MYAPAKHHPQVATPAAHSTTGSPPNSAAPNPAVPSNPAAQNYLRAKVLTATPEQLQMMLFDGGLRFAEQARVALNAKKYDESYEAMSRLQKIVLELRLSLKKDVSPDLTDKLTSIYTYIYNKLVQANVHRDGSALEEATRLFKYQRDTWALLLEQLSKSKAASAAATLDTNEGIPAPDARMEASICMQG